MRIFFLTFLMLIVSFTVSSQILNVQKSQLKKDSSSFTGSMTLSTSLYNRSAASDKKIKYFEFDFKSSFAFFIKNSRLAFINDFSYAEGNRRVIKSPGFQHIRYSMYEDGRFHPEAFIQYQYDNYRGLAPRLLGGVGFRHDLIETETFSFFYGPGVMYEYEVWQAPESKETSTKRMVKSSNYIGMHWDATESFNMNMISYFQTGYDGGAKIWRNRYSLELNMNTTISSRLTVNNSFSISHESDPVVDIIPTIYNLEVGLSYVFK